MAPAPSRARLVVLTVLLTLITAVAAPAERHLRAVSLLLGLSGSEPAWAQLVTSDVAIESLEIPAEVTSTKAPSIRARVYRPTSSIGAPRGMVLAHGVHWLGIDEPRLVALAKAFAKAGVTVLTPELGPLSDYRVDDEGNLDALRVSVRWLARDPNVRGGGVGLLGVSFAGGLALRVASEPALAADLTYVASIGGHHDMARVAKYFVTDKIDTPDGEIDWKAHDYGLAVLVYNTPERFVSANDAPHLRAAVRAFLRETYPAAESAALAMSPEGRAVFDRIAHRDRAALSAIVLRELPSMKPTMDAASPAGRMGTIKVPVYLLHGAHDDVVPPSESKFSARETPGEVHLLVTSKIGHAEMGKDENRLDEVRLVRFMAGLLD
jgi:pimeloyl-ACP methyl ester carboxylesterase